MKPKFGEPEPFEVIDGREMTAIWQEWFGDEPLYRKTALVRAFPADHAGIVRTPEGDMAFEKGDYLVADEPPTHVWPVKADIFERTYAEERGAHTAEAEAPREAVVHAATQLRDHIKDGLTSRTHLPGDLCFRQLDEALERLGEPAPTPEPAP